MGGRKLAADRVAAVLELLEAGLNPARAARAAGVSQTSAYNLDRRVRGVGRLEAKRAAAAAGAAERAAARQAAAARVRAVTDALASGMDPRQAAQAAGVSTTFAYQLDRKMGGVYRPPGVTYSHRYLDREERYEIARLREGGCTCGRSRGRVGRPRRSPGSWPATPTPGPAGISPSGRTGWPGTGSGGRSVEAGPRPGAAGAGAAAAATGGTRRSRSAGG